MQIIQRTGETWARSCVWDYQYFWVYNGNENLKWVQAQLFGNSAKCVMHACNLDSYPEGTVGQLLLLAQIDRTQLPYGVENPVLSVPQTSKETEEWIFHF